MTASKLFMTANARLALRTISGDAAAAEMPPIVADGFTPLKPGNTVLELTYDAGGVGRQSSLTLLMDPRSGAALQRSQHDQKGRFRWRVYRFGCEGAYQRTRWPASDAEETLPPARWTRTSEGLRAYPVAPDTQAVIEPTGLLYVIAAAELYAPGDHLDVLIFRRHDTQTVRIDVLPPREVSVRYDELRPTGTVQHNARVVPLRLSLRGLPVPGGDPDDNDLELLGLRGNLELLLDPATRAPLELSGDVKILGKVTLRLTAVRPLQGGGIK
ncbi:MAG: hypothetical protein R3F24_14900 [Gammaproteobacteria bacterium]